MENAGWRFELEGTSIVVPCEGPPWQTVAADATVILAGLGRRFNGNGDSHTTSEENRLNLWGTVQLANSGLVSERTLFESQNMDKRIAFILRSSERSEAPLQWLHIGHGTIPNKLADASCIGGHREELLCILNHIFQTRYSLDTPGLDDCLQYFVQQSRDLGELYGYLRPWWYGNLRDAVQKVAARKDELEAIRHNAIRDSCIQNSNIPPRRVWDLYSNRVLPLHAVPRDPDSKPEDIPSKVWCVSHSWVEDHRHVYVSTEINGQQWPVPIPRETTLDHVRIELLNMDAEYAWLDVLCLRQRGRDEDEMQRQEEWKLDVPTIGYTYSRPSTPCVIYFNGLGLPLDTSPIILRSTRQWFNRVWTLQESPLSWLPGGLSGKPLVDPHAFFDRLRSIVTAVNSRGDGSGLAQTLRERSCTNELDRIAGLAYIFQCRTLPIYNENVSPEVAWTLLLKHMDAERRTSISLQYPPCSPFGLWGSWERFLHSSKIPHASQPLISAGTSEDGSLKLVDPSQLYTDAQGVYFHPGYITESCRILLGGDAQAGAEEIEMSCGYQGESIKLSILGRHGILLDGMSYCLINHGEDAEHWVVGEVVGEQIVDEEEALLVARWAVIRVDQDEGQRLGTHVAASRRRMRIVYCTAEEAARRSSRVYDCIAVRDCHVVIRSPSVIDSNLVSIGIQRAG
ncbi:uncharacterized protein PHACADRAFT_91853 [Phanerochaete carnosa HHB-10118-sp]|uniref:Heterokaryon incompatibility domain-containing protein n=1 Tax=Phanerochaete carnosa (strain HHB-10118-sp) TaxID=650164 RepID=K5VXX9_PHACS|nr:uncharacterized protein PHACADRAFT_91853 [Phanerochaete carnosa HHB-10118-sp]EKM56423.1 hypothetical protein PHACADRAFT_91853 [Phanerochaete carnosa HHB-10118-sp]